MIHPEVIHPNKLKKEVANFDSAMVNKMAEILGSVGFIWFCIILDLFGLVALIQQTYEAVKGNENPMIVISLWVAFVAQAVIQLIALPVLQNYQNRQEASDTAKADADHQNMVLLVDLQNEQLEILKLLKERK